MFKLKQILLHKGQGTMLLLLASITLVVTGCGTENDLGTSTSTTPTAAKVTDIPQESADNYDDNVNGLITGNTLKGWIDDWTANRPEGITGKLVILQAADSDGLVTGAAGFEIFKPVGENVVSYNASEWVQTRINGVLQTVSMVPDGRSVDTFLAKYNIDPANDMIVCAPGSSTSTSQVMRAGRCWYMFRYWGVAKEHLAMLNGGNDWLASNTNLEATDFATTGSTAPGTGSATVKDLPEVNMVLQATLEDMMNVVAAQDINLLGDGVFIWDARGTTEYDPSSNSPVYVDANFRGGATQGHPNGALELNFSSLLNGADGNNSWKPKAELQAYMNGEVDADSIGFVDATLGGVGSGNAYQQDDVVYTYCQTTYRAMITGFATVAILGKPTRFYDGAMTEWHSLNTVVNSSGFAPLPFDSPWRTDLVTVSGFEYHSDPTNPNPVPPVTTPPSKPRPVVVPSISNAYADSANAIVNEDMEYKGVVLDGGNNTVIVVDGGASGGGALPPNPCGG